MLRLYKFSRTIRRYFFSAFDIALVGFWLGILSKNLLHQIDELYYTDEKMYYSDGYNSCGLWEWEEQVITKFFQDRKKIILLGAGGGREVFGLKHWPFQIDAFECNPKLVEYANSFLERNEVPASIELSERDGCPKTESVYDGAVVGWGGYMLIQGSGSRIAFLRDLRSRLLPGSPVLISFFVLNGPRKFFAGVSRLANFFRFILRRERTEIGDFLEPNYVHYFTKGQILAEFAHAGYELEFYSKKPYGHAVGLAKLSDLGQEPVDGDERKQILSLSN